MGEQGTQARVADIMTRSEEVAHLYEVLETVLDRMIVRRLCALPVVDGDRLVGMITSADIRGHAGRIGEMKVSDIVAMGTHHCFEHDIVADAASTMEALGVHHLAVLDADDKLVGVIAASDIPAQTEPHAPVRQSPGENESKESHPGLRVYSDKPKLKY